ncbi:hypothetical protein JTB14_022993 [Gonioctena quinquepunctata]|nr:hypothetical protein JTB14_022993 [Gonioctena quinquepunctata]
MESFFLGPEWHISEDGEKKITENGTIRAPAVIYRSALDTDLKEICSPMLSNELAKNKLSKIVLQIQKIRNISAPKSNEESQAAPRMLKLSLTDGDSYVQALEIDNISSISRNKTPPGTKIQVNNPNISSGYLLLTPTNCTVLGGRVPILVEKWEIAKNVQRNNRGNSSEDGPPPWVNFGTKIQNSLQETHFKSLAGKNKDGAKDNSDFELQRQGAIAEATTGATKKVFSGRVKQNIQPAKTTEPLRDKKDQSRSRTKPLQRDKEEAEKPLKPSEKVSLFSFLEDKLPANDSQTTAKNSFPSDNRKSYSAYRNGAFQKETQKASVDFGVPPTKSKTGGDSIHVPQPKAVVKSNINFVNGSSDRLKAETGNHSQTVEKKTNNNPSYNNQSNFHNRYDNRNDNRYDNRNVNSGRSNNRPQNKSFGSWQQRKNENSSPKNQNENSNKFEPPVRLSDKANENVAPPEPKYVFHKSPNSANMNIGKPCREVNENITSENMVIPNVNEVANNVEKMSLNSQFASRSLRQHLNLGPTKKNDDFGNSEGVNCILNVGDECLAKYWEDGKFYEAMITAITEKTFAVQFKGYGNFEEILKSDCRPFPSNKSGYNPQNRRYDPNTRPYSGPLEYRRSSRNFK